MILGQDWQPASQPQNMTITCTGDVFEFFSQLPSGLALSWVVMFWSGFLVLGTNTIGRSRSVSSQFHVRRDYQGLAHLPPHTSHVRHGISLVALGPPKSDNGNSRYFFPACSFLLLSFPHSEQHCPAPGLTRHDRALNLLLRQFRELLPIILVFPRFLHCIYLILRHQMHTAPTPPCSS